MATRYADAVAAFRASAAGQGWADLPFFLSGRALRVASEIDRRAALARASGRAICPTPDDVFAALARTPFTSVRAVIVGQDPYPNPRNAHGLCFSAPRGQPIPASLKTIYRSLKLDLGLPLPATGDLGLWAERGVLLLNATLTVEEGRPNSHGDAGWNALAGEIMARLSQNTRPLVFFAWGGFAQKLMADVDIGRHLVLASRHPSNMGLKAGESGDNHPFITAHSFSRAKAWWQKHGEPPLDWQIT